MQRNTQILIEQLWSQDRDLQNRAFGQILALTDQPVDWGYEIWDELLQNLSDKDNHNRAISAQILCNLAKSDPQNRMLRDFGRLLAVTRDERFVTARHCMQALWKVGAAGGQQENMLVDGLAGRFQDCIAEKNCTLIRYDILESLKNLYEATKHGKIREIALELIESESDLKYRKKYGGLWRKR